MAIDRSSVKTRKRGGWNVEESSPTPAPEFVAGTSAIQVPRALSISFDGIRQAFADTIGNSLWYLFSEGYGGSQLKLLRK